MQVIQMLMSGQDDLNWFESSLDKLKLSYNNKFIAFKNKKVIESDPNLDNLINKLNKKGIDSSNLFIKFVSKVKAIL
jgi:hypothetical protein